MKIKLLLSATMLFSISTLFAQHKLVLQPDSTKGKDASVSFHQDYVNTNLGTDPIINPYAWTNGGVLNIKRTFIEFDWSILPSNAQIDSAFLYLYYVAHVVSDHSGDNELWIRRVTDTWAENSVTWNNQPDVDTTKQVYVRKSTSSTQNYKIQVTELIKHIMNSGNNYGLRISLADESIYKRVMIASSNHTDATKHPKLEIHYTGWGLNTSKISNENQVKVYPNPSIGVVNFSFSEPIKKATKISIFSMTGQLVKQVRIDDINSVSIDCKDLKGIYYYQINNETNQLITNSGKLIIN